MENVHPQYDRQFVDQWWNMTRDFLEATLKGEHKVADIKQPHELHKLIAVEIGDEPCSQEHLIEQTKKVLQHQTKPYHPHFHDQMFGGFDQSSFLGAATLPALNGSVYTFEMAPVFTLLEEMTWQHLRKCIGWEQIDATMTPGGAIANLFAVHLAKNFVCADIHKKGVCGYPTLKIFSSEAAMESISKAAGLTGVGTNHVVAVKTDGQGRMVPDELEKTIKDEIEKGSKPLMVNLTLGTSVEGTIDPIPQCSAIAKKYDCWVHVDGVFGGPFLISPQLRERLGSFEHVDSVSFDADNSLVVPKQASFFLCKHRNLAKRINSLKADYLFHQQRASYDGDLDVGDKQLMCGRVADILKCWTYFKLNGWKGVASHVEKEHQLAKVALQHCQKHADRFKLAFEAAETFTTCFWCLPKGMDKAAFATEQEYWALLGRVHVLAKKLMVEEGKIMVNYAKTKGKPYFWRVVANNPFADEKQVQEKLELIGQYCQRAYTQISSKKE